MVGAIVGFRLKVKRIDAKFKMSQNRSPDDRGRVAAALDAEPYADAAATAAWMRACRRRIRMARPERRRSGDERPGGSAAIRFDKWLWAARFYKTRALAAQAIETGQARLGSERVKPAHAVRAGDAVSVRKQGTVWDVEVTGLADRRGCGDAPRRPSIARSPESVARAQRGARAPRAAAATAPRFAGRPTKRERRKLADFLDEP